MQIYLRQCAEAKVSRVSFSMALTKEILLSGIHGTESIFMMSGGIWI